MSLLGGKKTVASLTKKAGNILNIFEKTKNECVELNREIAIVVSQKKEEMDILVEEVAELTSLTSKNENVINKIDTFLKS